MISRQDVERLAQLKSEHGILSAYIHMDPRLRFVRLQGLIQFKGAVKKFETRREAARWREALDRESARVLDYLSTLEPAGQGLAIFSCQPEGLWGHMLHDRDYVAFSFVLDEHTKKQSVFLYEREFLW